MPAAPHHRSPGLAPRRAWAPGRANLVGEHTDYNGGLCLPIALPLGTTAIWTPDGSSGPDAPLELVSEGLGRWQGRIADLAVPATGWQRYALGALQAVHHQHGGVLTIESTVPTGSGLSSSAAVICAVLRAVRDAPNEQLVAPAVEAETAWAQAPTGGLDQTISLLGEQGTALCLDFGTGDRSRVSWAPEDDGVHLVVIDSRVRHDNADGGYARRRSECEQAAAMLGVDILSAARAEDVDMLPPVLAARARHVLTENDRVREVVTAATERDWARVGNAFTASHVSLRDDFEVSCPEVDAGVEAALATGALGARMTGGGFGGAFLVLTTDPERVLAAVRARFAESGWAEPVAYGAPASAGAHRLP